MKNKKLFLGILAFILVGGLVIGTTQIPLKEKYFEIVKGAKIQEPDLQQIIQKEFPDTEIIESTLEKNDFLGKKYYEIRTRKEGELGLVQVDANSGEILMFLVDKIYSTSKYKNKSKLSSAQIKKINIEYFPKSAEYVLIKENEEEHEIRYHYKRVVKNVSIIPDSMALVFDLYFGDIVSYSKYHHETLPDLEPKITAQEAEEKAYKKMNSNKKELTGEKDSRLIVDTNLVGNLKLFWEVKLYSNKPYAGYYYIVYVDAKDGSISFMDALL